MILILHVLAAIASLIAAGNVYLSPTKMKLRLTYVLTGGMLASGTYLVILNSSHLLQACVMGLSLLAVITYAVVRARSKLALAQI